MKTEIQAIHESILEADGYFPEENPVAMLVELLAEEYGNDN